MIDSLESIEKCDSKCEISKRDLILNNVRSKLERISLWNYLNPEIKYHTVPRSSVGFLIDGNMRGTSRIVRNLVLNLMLLYSRDTRVSISLFRRCSKMISLPNQPMGLRWQSYRQQINRVIIASKMKGLGPLGARVVTGALNTLSNKVVNDAKSINTSMKFIYLITNGPIKGSQPFNNDFKQMKRKLDAQEVKLYIIHLGSRHNICGLKALTPSPRIFIAYHMYQLIYGGLAISPLYKNLSYRKRFINIKGVVPIIKNRMLSWARFYKSTLGNVVYKKGGRVGWQRDTIDSSFVPLTASEAVYPTTLSRDELSPLKLPSLLEFMTEVEKRQRINPRPRDNIRERSSQSIRNTYNSLKGSWNWTNIFPALQEGVLGRANNIVMMDSMRVSSVSITEKLIYHIHTLFPITISKFTMMGFSGAFSKTVANKKVFSHKEDIRKVVTSTPTTPMRAPLLVPHLSKIISPLSRILSSRIKNNVFIFITHRTPDLIQTARRFGQLYASRRIRLYIFGPGLRDQEAVFRQLTIPSRIFTSYSRFSFYSQTRINNIVRILRMDNGVSEKVLNLIQSSPTMSRGMGRTSASSRASSVNRMNRRASRNRNTQSRNRSRGSMMNRANQTNRRRGNSAARSRRYGGRRVIGRSGRTYRGNKRQIQPRQSGRTTNRRRPGQNRNNMQRRIGSRVSTPRRASSQRRVSPQRRISTQRRLLQRINPMRINTPSGVVGPANLFFAVDATLWNQMANIRPLASAVINMHQRLGTYVSLAYYSISPKFITNFDQFKNGGEVNRAVNRLRGIRSRFRNTGRMLTEIRRTIISSDPCTPPIVILILNGPSSDNYKTSALELRKIGVKVIALVIGNTVSDREVLSIISSPQLAFRIDINRLNNIAKILLGLFKSINGERIGRISSNGRHSISQLSLLKTWGWKTYRSGLIYQKIDSSQVSYLIGAQKNSDSIMKFAYNTVRLFRRTSRQSFRVVGLSGIAGIKVSSFRQYSSPYSIQTALQSLVSTITRIRRISSRSSFRSRNIRRGRGGRMTSRTTRRTRRRQPRDIIEDLFNEEMNSDKKQIIYPKRTRPLTNFMSRRPRISTSNAGSPNRFSTNKGNTRPIGQYKQGMSKTNDFPKTQYTQNTYQPRVSGLITDQETKISPKTRFSNRIGSVGRLDINDNDFKDDYQTSKTDLSSPKYSSTYEQKNRFDGLSADLKEGSSVAQSINLDQNAFGNRKNNFENRLSGSRRRQGRKVLNRWRPAVGRKNPGAIRRIGTRRLANRRIGTRRLANRRIGSNRRICRDNIATTLENLAKKINRIYIMNRRYNLSPANGPNKNKVAIIILGEFPRRSRCGSQRSIDGGYRAAARRLKSINVRLAVVVMQRVKTINHFSEPFLRQSADLFIHGTWSRAQSHIIQLQRVLYNLMGRDDSSPVERLSQTQINYKLKSISSVPIWSSYVPPAYETYMTSNFLIDEPHLKKTSNWNLVVAGLRSNYIKGSINVIISVDISPKPNGFIVRDHVANIVKMFDKRLSRFTLVLMGTNTRIVKINAILRTRRQNQNFLNSIRLQRGKDFSPSYGSTFTKISEMIPRLRRARKTLAIAICRSSSADDVMVPVSRLKQNGVTVAAFGIGFKYNIIELQTMASSGCLVFHGQISMLPLLQFRFQAEISAVLHGPVGRVGLVSGKTISVFRQESTVFKGKDAPESSYNNGDYLGILNRFTSKRDEILIDSINGTKYFDYSHKSMNSLESSTNFFMGKVNYTNAIEDQDKNYPEYNYTTTSTTTTTAIPTTTEDYRPTFAPFKVWEGNLLPVNQTNNSSINGA